MPAFRELSTAKAAWVRELMRHKRIRDGEGVFVIEGRKPVREVLGRGMDTVGAIIVTEPFLEKCEPILKGLLEASRHLVFTCRHALFESLADTTTPAGILAVVRKPLWDHAAVLARQRVFGLYGETLQDPANVGAIIRTAAAFAMDGVWLSLDSADVFNPKVVRATAGTLLRLPVFPLKDPAVFSQFGCSLLAAEPPGRGSVAIQSLTTVSPKTVLAFGNESRGLSRAVLKQADARFHIPVTRGVESLNVAASVAIAAFYFNELSREDRSE